MEFMRVGLGFEGFKVLKHFKFKRVNDFGF